MHDEMSIQQFIERRSQGRPFARLGVELNISKPTLTKGSRTQQFHQRAVRKIRGDEYDDGDSTWQA